MALKIALAGNPNSGKTTLFNALTGSNQYVGNWPGVTVEKKEGKLKNNKEVMLIDLPGVYSLSPYTLEEVVARNYLLEERPDAILNIVDGTNLERNLYLSTQLLELGIPVVMAVNMMDVVKKNGDHIDLEKLSKTLGCEVISISALKGTGISEAAEKAVAAAKKGNTAKIQHKFDEKVEQALSKIEDAISGMEAVNAQKRFFAIKLFEKDEKMLEQIPLNAEVSEQICCIREELENELDDDAESIIANERYVCIGNAIEGAYKKKKNRCDEYVR